MVLDTTLGKNGCVQVHGAVYSFPHAPDIERLWHHPIPIFALTFAQPLRVRRDENSRYVIAERFTNLVNNYPTTDVTTQVYVRKD